MNQVIRVSLIVRRSDDFADGANLFPLNEGLDTLP